jgi:hypothetical protein
MGTRSSAPEPVPDVLSGAAGNTPRGDAPLPATSARFSVRRGLSHAVLASGAVMAGSVVFLLVVRLVGHHDSVPMFLRLVSFAVLAVLTAVPTFGASYLFQTKRRRLGWLTVGLYGALVVVLFSILAFVILAGRR